MDVDCRRLMSDNDKQRSLAQLFRPFAQGVLSVRFQFVRSCSAHLPLQDVLAKKPSSKQLSSKISNNSSASSSPKEIKRQSTSGGEESRANTFNIFFDRLNSYRESISILNNNAVSCPGSSFIADPKCSSGMPIELLSHHRQSHMISSCYLTCMTF